ncbi:unnamed protein product [Victoria cruziana]
MTSGWMRRCACWKRVWQQVKLHYIGLLTDHLQPELAETFFNSVCTRILHHSYFHNGFIFVRPAISTEYIENEEPAAKPTYRAYYPSRETLRDTLQRIVTNFQLTREFEDLGRDVDWVLHAMRRELGDFRWRANFQIQVLSSLFYRNKGAYLVGKIVNGFKETPFALPILHNAHGRLYIDAALFGEDDLLMLFSFARAYFMVDMAVPSAFVRFLRSLMPRKPHSEIYSALGLQKQGKNLFYRDFLNHLRHSSDQFRSAPGIKGLKEHTTRETVQGKYLLVKQHDRVGRMADTLEYSNVAFPRYRFSEELLAELRHFCPSLLEERGEDLVIRHLYIERRMVPLNLYLQEATPAQLAHANFGIPLEDGRHGKVVFYDYDEIEYLSDCNFRRVPAPRNEEDELSGEVWYPVGPRDVFPETFAPFLLGHPGVREAFMRHHAELLDAGYWQAQQARIRAGYLHDVFPYEAQRRFHVQPVTPLPREPALP